MIKRYENYIMLKITKYLWTKKHGLLINASFTGYFASKERKGWDQVYEMSWNACSRSGLVLLDASN